MLSKKVVIAEADGDEVINEVKKICAVLNGEDVG